jgi:branched-chain amino acid aminotransferase
MTTPLAYLNGKLVPFAEAALPLHDAGFVSGATVVDNARTFRHKLFRWPDHLARFRRNCGMCYVPLEATDEQLTATAEELVAHNAKLLPPGGELQLVTFATPGPLGFYLGDTSNGPPPTLGMVTYPLPFARYRPFFTKGIVLAFAGRQSYAVNDALPPTVKHRSRLHWHIAERSINDPLHPFFHPGAVPVVHDGWGAIDTAIGCPLAATADTVFRPPRDAVQDSISVRVVEELCAAVGLAFSVAPFNMDRLGRRVLADDAGTPRAAVSEMMLAGTGFCLAGVRAYEFYIRGDGRAFEWPGPVFRKLLAAWSDLVGVDIEKQFTQP